MKPNFKASYDNEEDVLTFYKSGKNVKESIEISEEIVLDFDKDKKVVSLEIRDAYEFLHGMNSKFTKKMLIEISNVELQVKKFRNYWIIVFLFKYNNQIITERLPAFSPFHFESPLIASIST